jgi:hypothetical protein
MVNLSKIVVKHLCYEKGWDGIKLENPITLIISSFPSSTTFIVMGKCGFPLPSKYKYRRI